MSLVYRSLQPKLGVFTCSAVDGSHVNDQPDMPEPSPQAILWEEGAHPEESDPLELGFSLDNED